MAFLGDGIEGSLKELGKLLGDAKCQFMAKACGMSLNW
jgi:hypothetical protein